MTAAGSTWIGPHADAIDAMGDKLRARSAMQAAGVPIVPGGTELVADVARRAPRRRSVWISAGTGKPPAGGGGKGLKVARTEAEIESAFDTALPRSRNLL